MTGASPQAEAGKDWFRILAESTSTAIAAYDDRLLYVNPACEKLSGYSREELLALPDPRVLIHPDFRAAMEERRHARLSGEVASEQYETKIIRKNGEERWVGLQATPVPYERGIMLMVNAIDIHDRKTSEIALEQTQERLRLAQRASRAVVWDWEAETDSLQCSALAVELGGPEVAEHLTTGRGFLDLIHPEDRDDQAAEIAKVLRGKRSLKTQIRLVLPSGAVRWISLRAESVRDHRDRVVRLTGVAFDFTERKLAEEALFREIDRAQVTLSSIADGVIRTDAHGAIDFLNPVAERLTGRTLAEAYGRPVSEIYRVIDEATRIPLFDPVEQAIREGRSIAVPGNRILLHVDDIEFNISDSVVPIRDRDGEIVGAVLVFKDLSQVREMEDEMHYLTRHDALTELINRRAFEEEVEELIDQLPNTGRQHALCYLDLDEFKLINDSCGHTAGDEFIRQITSVLVGKVRPTDIVARMGGDEFAILLTDCAVERATTLAEDLAEAVRRVRFSWEDRIYAVGASIGLVPIDQESDSAEVVLKAADAACHVAKESGRNRIHVYQEGDTAIAERSGEMHWISRIHQALADERFVLYQQPLSPLSSRASKSPLFEILVRMLDESGALVPPNDFIPSAERYHLISAIDRWVIRNAFAALSRVDTSIRFVLNVSGQSVSEESFQSFVLDQFRSSGVAPERVLFEITETAAIADLQRAMRFISIFKGLGCRFVLDDFGKGVSSYTYLKNLPVDFLKIEGEFVRRMLDDPIEAAIVASINQVGQVVGLQTIAECVETREVFDAVRSSGIDYAQGFWLARPAKLDPDAL
jgi:diguanylate cyclase (GGDEF)-like protein/PAS domain S-box-containing protein